MKRYIIAKSTIDPLMFNFAKMIKNGGARVESISIYEPTSEEKNVFDKCHYILNPDQKKKQVTKVGMAFTYLKILRNIKKVKEPLKKCDIVIGVSEPNAFVYFIFLFAQCKKVFFPYEITHLRYKRFTKNKWYNWMFEKKNFKHADAIIHKIPKDIFKNISEKKNIQFLPYTDTSKMIKSYDKLEGLHIAYIGYVNKNELFDKIAKSNIHLHLYATNYHEAKNKFAHNHECIHLNKINTQTIRNDISKYHYGLYLPKVDNSFKKEWNSTYVDGAFSFYLEAGLPIISFKDLAFLNTFINEYNLGIVMDDISLLHNILKETKYENLQRYVLFNRHRFCFEKHCHELSKFFGEICNN